MRHKLSDVLRAISASKISWTLCSKTSVSGSRAVLGISVAPSLLIDRQKRLAAFLLEQLRLSTRVVKISLLLSG